MKKNRREPVGKLKAVPAKGLKDRRVHYVTVREANGPRVVSVQPSLIAARAAIAVILIQRKGDG